MKNSKMFLIGCLVVLLTAPFAGAADGPLTSFMVGFQVTTDDKGNEQLVPTTETVPGETIEYQMVYANTGKDPLKGIVINAPIPPFTTYVANSARTAARHQFQVSIDKGATWDSEPVKRMRQGPDGTLREVIVGVDEYTHLRWGMEENLAGAASFIVNYRVKVQ